MLALDGAWNNRGKSLVKASLNRIDSKRMSTPSHFTISKHVTITFKVRMGFFSLCVLLLRLLFANFIVKTL